MRYLLLCLLAVPAAAQSPSVDELVQAYIGAPWIMVPADSGDRYVCIAEADSKRVDWIVSRMYEQAKGVQCS